MLAAAGLVGTMLRQVQPSSLHDVAAYAAEMATIHRAYDPLTILGVNVGPTLTDVFERLGLFEVFNSWWFASLLVLLVVSIVVCTIDRTPRLWRSVHDVRVVQPEAFYDERLPHRARLDGVRPDPDEVARVLRRHHFAVRHGESTLQGERNQYFKLFTLLTHLGLVLFLAAGAITGMFGFETVLFLGNGQTAPVQAVGAKDNLIVKNLGFQAPQRADGSFADFRTDIAVYENGREVARKTIRVNDPLVVNGYVFHQNTFGPAELLEIRAPDGRLVWTGPVLLDGQLLGLPEGTMPIPGSSVGLLLVLDKDASGAPVLTLQGLTADETGQQVVPVFLQSLAEGATTDPATTAGYTIRWAGLSAFTGMVVKQDPGQNLVWIAFLCLILGLVLTFYFPRRRAWIRMSDDGLAVALLTDRHVDVNRELESLLRDLRAVVGPAPGSRTADPAEAG